MKLVMDLCLSFQWRIRLLGKFVGEYVCCYFSYSMSSSIFLSLRCGHKETEFYLSKFDLMLVDCVNVN